MRRLLTNCPNCAGVLNSDGSCPYCKTKVRYTNELDIQADRLCGEQVELLINIKRGDETIMYPFIGYLDSMEMRYGFHEVPLVQLIFNGTLMNERR